MSSPVDLADARLTLADTKPEDKVKIAVSMVDVVTRICAEGVKATDPTITEEKLISLLRRRFLFGRDRSREE